jgi:hypothetical protein
VSTLKRLYRFHFRNEKRERAFLASLGFLATFGGVRAITYMIHVGVGPFHNVVTSGGLHIHHLVWGFLLLLLVGLVWLLEVGVGSSWLASVTAIVFGLAAALSLDEFALMLDLRDVYWERQGRVSVDVAVLFFNVLLLAWWGGPFLAGLVREAWHRVSPA